MSQAAGLEHSTDRGADETEREVAMVAVDCGFLEEQCRRGLRVNYCGEEQRHMFWEHMSCQPRDHISNDDPSNLFVIWIVLDTEAAYSLLLSHSNSNTYSETSPSLMYFSSLFSHRSLSSLLTFLLSSVSLSFPTDMRYTT